MPRLPCRVSIIGPPQVGKTTLCKLVAQHYGAVVLDMEELLQPVLFKAEQERINKIKEETTHMDIKKVKAKMAKDAEQNLGKLSFVDNLHIQSNNLLCLIIVPNVRLLYNYLHCDH